jgi:hypothetical protein
MGDGCRPDDIATSITRSIAGILPPITEQYAELANFDERRHRFAMASDERGIGSSEYCMPDGRGHSSGPRQQGTKQPGLCCIGSGGGPPACRRDPPSKAKRPRMKAEELRQHDVAVVQSRGALVVAPDDHEFTGDVHHIARLQTGQSLGIAVAERAIHFGRIGAEN